MTGDPELSIPDLTVVLQPSASNGCKKVSYLLPQHLTCVAKTWFGACFQRMGAQLGHQPQVPLVEVGAQRARRQRQRRTPMALAAALTPAPASSGGGSRPAP